VRIISRRGYDPARLPLRGTLLSGETLAARLTYHKDQRLIEELYTDSVKFLKRVPRVEPEVIAPIEALGARVRPEY